MKLILIRHGESVANEQGFTQGKEDEWRDTPLSKNGIKQAEKVAERLKNEEIDKIYSSDLKRAKQTAQTINKFLKIEIQFDKRLREKIDDETGEEFMSRINSFFNEHKKSKDKILIVAHGHVNFSLIYLAKEKDKKSIKNARFMNTSVSILEKEGEHFSIELINCFKHLGENKEIIQSFETVQKIPYRVCKYEEENINENIKFGDCRHKSQLLLNLLTEKGFKAQKIKVIFNWRDLPIPKNTINILKNSSTVWTHDIVRVKIHGNYLYLDPTWNPELEKKGFPVTKEWNGLEDTKQVTDGEIEFYKEKEFNEKKEEILKEHKIKIDKEEAYKFAEALNDGLKN